MRTLIILALTLVFSSIKSPSLMAFTDPKIGGTVYMAKEHAGKYQEGTGVLYVYARTPGVKVGPPVAVFRFEKPRFPQAFVLTAKNLIIKENQFLGPFEITALLVPSGDPLNKKGGFQGTDPKNKTVHLGVKNLSITLTEAL